MQVTLAEDGNGQLGANPLCADDYLVWAAFRRETITSIDFEEIKSTDSLVFPNPAANKITVVNIVGEYKVSIVDITGKIVYEGIYNQDNAELNVSGFKPASYIMRIVQGDRVKMIKLIIKR